MLDLHKDHVPNKTKLPLYGPLNIEDHERFLYEEADKFKASYGSRFPYQLYIDNFRPLFQLAKGAFGAVVLVKYKLFGTYYAMKVLKKKTLVEKNQVQKALNEKLLLQSLNCPFTIYLMYFSQDNSNLYFILPFVRGGELYSRLVQFVRFSENLSKFYAAQVVLALEYLHRCGVVYRDLKPENILLDHFGYIKITDLGLAKMVSRRTYTFCGTPDYVAPEVVLGLGHSKAVDWWGLGVLIFEMSVGHPPFYSSDETVVFEKIVKVKYAMPEEFKKDLKDLVHKLLQFNVTQRMGNKKEGVEEIKRHAWFTELDWLALLNRQVMPPFVPSDTSLNSLMFPDMKRISRLQTEGEDIYVDCFSDF